MNRKSGFFIVFGNKLTVESLPEHIISNSLSKTKFSLLYLQTKKRRHLAT